ncbi:RHS domain-containing protein [Streptomyces sp. BHT-5-2]|nr:RHS domain-containing protein [Streptomyces sp. BHT-5-2]
MPHPTGGEHVRREHVSNGGRDAEPVTRGRRFEPPGQVSWSDQIRARMRGSATGICRLYRWTPEGRLAARRNPDGTEEAWTHDGEGNCSSYTDPLGQVTTFEYGHFEQLTARTDPDGTRHEFLHDTELRLQKVTNPQGLTWCYTYDAAGRLVSETDFDKRVLTYTYDGAGQLATRTNALGETIAFTRDAAGRITEKNAAGYLTSYHHDAAGNLLQAVGPDATVTLVRDALGRVTAETVNGRTISTTYDALGRQTSRTTPAGHTTTYSYDAAGNRTVLNSAGRVLTSIHDAAGRETTRSFGDTFTLANVWDPTGRLSAQTLTSAISPSRPLQQRGYTYRDDGNLTALHDQLSGITRAFTLDPLGRVTAVQAGDWTESYAYDEAGNQTHAEWPDGHPGSAACGERTYTGTRVTRAGRIRYEHDALGRTTLRQKVRLSRSSESWHYTWDTEDRLTGVTTPDGTQWRYRYDPLGRRIAKERLGPDNRTVAERTDFTWDGTVLAEQVSYAPAATEAIALTWDHFGWAPVAQTERKLVAARCPEAGTETGGGAGPVPDAASGTVPGCWPSDLSQAPQSVIDERFFLIATDLAGTPTELVSETGEIAWRTRTTLWGTLTWNRTATAYTPLRFPGQYFDDETALHYNYFRHYDPETGRYLSADPLGLEPADNPVAYVSNPLMWIDPQGLSPYPNKKAEDKPAPTVRMRHYTNSRGKQGILDSGVIRASDQNKVFMVPAKGKLMSPRDAEAKLGIGRGRGNNVVEFDAPADRVSSRYNSKFGFTEWVADGDLEVTNIRVAR